MREQWEELKETIIELRDNNGTATQQEVCQFLFNLMNVLESERKKRKWIAVKGTENGITRYTCSECGASYECDSRDVWDFNYCPNCGSENGD